MLQPIRSGTSGFRGVTSSELTIGHARAIGASYGKMLMGRRPGERILVPVGHDQRWGAGMLAQAAAIGLQGVGADVRWLGQVCTPVFLSNMALREGCAGGIEVTGSHMPPERGGIIPMNSDGTYCDRDVTDALEAHLPGFQESTPLPPQELGMLKYLDSGESLEFYIRKAMRRIDAVAAIQWRRFKILIDPGNGVGGHPALALFAHHLSCDVQTINFEPKAKPDRASECRAESCTEAIKIAKEGMVDLVVCYDGDADRGIFITPNGTVLSEDVVGGIFARAVLQQGDACVATVDCSGLIEVICKERGATLYPCRIGQPDTGRAVKEYKAAYAYEPAAKYWFPKAFMWYDAIFATAKMLELMATSRKSLTELAFEVPKFFQARHAMPLPDAQKARVVERAFSVARSHFGTAVREVTIDGLKFVFPDCSWLLLRPSGTEPLARVYADARTQEDAEQLKALGVRFFEEAIREVK